MKLEEGDEMITYILFLLLLYKSWFFFPFSSILCLELVCIFSLMFIKNTFTQSAVTSDLDEEADEFSFSSHDQRIKSEQVCHLSVVDMWACKRVNRKEKVNYFTLLISWMSYFKIQGIDL